MTSTSSSPDTEETVQALKEYASTLADQLRKYKGAHQMLCAYYSVDEEMDPIAAVKFIIGMERDEHLGIINAMAEGIHGREEEKKIVLDRE